MPAPSPVLLPEIADAKRKKYRRIVKRLTAEGRHVPKKLILPPKPPPVRPPRAPKKAKKGKSPYQKGKKAAPAVEVMVVRRKPSAD